MSNDLQKPNPLKIDPLKQVSAYYLVRYVFSHLDPERKEKEETRRQSAAVLRRLDDRGLFDSRSDNDDDDDHDGAGAGDDGTGHRLDERAPRRPRKEDLELNKYEQTIAMEVVAPEDIPVSFEGDGLSVVNGEQHVGESRTKTDL